MSLASSADHRLAVRIRSTGIQWLYTHFKAATAAWPLAVSTPPISTYLHMCVYVYVCVCVCVYYCKSLCVCVACPCTELQGWRGSDLNLCCLHLSCRAWLPQPRIHGYLSPCTCLQTRGSTTRQALITTCAKNQQLLACTHVFVPIFKLSNSAYAACVAFLHLCIDQRLTSVFQLQASSALANGRTDFDTQGACQSSF